MIQKFCKGTKYPVKHKDLTGLFNVCWFCALSVT